MFREPAVEATKPLEKKSDPTAPARSSIRRQRSVRYPAHPHRDRQSSRHPQSHHHDRPLVDVRRLRDRARVLSTRSDALNIEIAADQAHTEASRQRRLESGRAILRDALSYEHTHQPISMRTDSHYPSNLLRPPTSSSASFRHPSRHSRHRPVIGHGGLLSRPRAEVTQTPPPAYIPSPRYTSPGRSNRSSPDDSAAVSLTPRFAPAHVQAHFENLEQSRSERPQPSHEDATASDPLLDDFPPLHRVSRRHSPSRGRAVHGDVDGLGDRWRSVSPDMDPWEILLSTMPPDERLPSTSASSFRSNEDSAPREELGELGESMGNGLNRYPVICNNSDSDFTEAEEEAQRVSRPQMSEQPYASSFLTRSVRDRRFRRHPDDHRSQRHLDEMGWLTSNQRASMGRPSRERL
ncbi:MAG: hypothetical protein Q9226_000113 [Calogaya cf. arnoldii]